MPEVREFVVRRVAVLEIQDAANWYEDRVPELGIRFLEEVDACFESVRVMPERYPVVHRGIRRALLEQFPTPFISSGATMRWSFSRACIRGGIRNGGRAHVDADPILSNMEDEADAPLALLGIAQLIPATLGGQGQVLV